VSDRGVWDEIEAEARDAFASEGRFPLPAYSEFMPAPWVGIKPYAPSLAARACTALHDGNTLDITEYEQGEIELGLYYIAQRVTRELDQLIAGRPHELSAALLEGNPAWPGELVASAALRREAGQPLVLALALALSRTQDDKGNVRWTLFGLSHDGPGAAFWRSFADDDRDRFATFVSWATGGLQTMKSVRVLADPAELPAFARELLLPEGKLPADLGTLVTFRPFAALPPAVQQAYHLRRLLLVPHPATLIFSEHPGYRRLAQALPRATQIPLLQLFPHVEDACRIRIPQSGWLDEHAPSGARASGGHRLVHTVRRSHRWQKVGRVPELTERATFDDAVSTVLFSVAADDLGLYGKPMAKNAEIWNERYELVLDGPRATPVELARAGGTVDRGGRFGYRFFYPPMRAGVRELYWHLPLLVQVDRPGEPARVRPSDGLAGYVAAETVDGVSARPPLRLAPRLLARPAHREAAAFIQATEGRNHRAAAENVRKLLAFGELLGGRMAPSFARALVHAPKSETLAAWREGLAETVRDGGLGPRTEAAIDEVLDVDAGKPVEATALTFSETATRSFEERLWRTIAALAEGDYRTKESADSVLVNEGKTGGRAARAAGLTPPGPRRDLDRLGDHLHDRYRALIEAHGMTGAARVVDHPFRWQTDFPYRWSGGWVKNQTGEASERNVVLMIPGRDRGQAVIMADHYDTAYMEDVYETERGGDGLRAAAAGADDNHSATAALLAAAEVLLPLARAGKLARDVWLVHLTGEEFPADCLGARMLAQALVERRLRFATEEGTQLDLSQVRVVGAFVLDMVAHNRDRDRDVFQIAPGEGAASAGLARTAHAANEAWNRAVPGWNQAPDRQGKPRAARQAEGHRVPPPFAHLPLHGEIRPEWDPRSALYNTDGQIFSDVGVPVVLFMENYDINRTGYHDTDDTMKNIDLDYAAALAAIAIETVTRVASDDS
jgi:hypothetical protein